MDDELRQYLVGLEERLNRRIDELEARLPNAEHNAERTMHLRHRTALTRVSMLDELLALVEQRLYRLELRLLGRKDAPSA
jgi:hypothetical protein